MEHDRQVSRKCDKNSGNFGNSIGKLFVRKKCDFVSYVSKMCVSTHEQRRRGPVVGHSLWTRPARVQSPWEARIIRRKNLALYIRDCESLCLSDETVKAVGPFYLVSMPGEVKYPKQGGKCVTCRGLHIVT